MSTADPSDEEARRRRAPSPDDPATDRRGAESEGAFRHVFGSEIPAAERAWRRPGEDDDERGEERPPEGGDAVLWALESLPSALREIRQEVRRAADMAADALATAASIGPGDGGSGAPAGIERLPEVLGQLRDEVRHAGGRAADALTATRAAMDSLPSFLVGIREELESTLGGLRRELDDAVRSIRAEVESSAERVDAATQTANQEAARAFSVVAREVRSLGDRQTVLREEVKLLGRRLEELERQRRRQAVRSGGRAPTTRPVPEPPPGA